MDASVVNIKLMADIADLQAKMQAAQNSVGTAMGGISMSMVKVKETIDLMESAERARASTFSRTMEETRRLLAIAKTASDETAKSLAALKINPGALNIPQESLDNLKTWQERSAYAIGAGAAVGWSKAKEAWESFKSYTEKTVIIWGVAVATGIAAAALSAVYAVYKSIDFAVGLITGESYKSANIDALVKMNDEVQALQESLPLTAVGASSLNEALKASGVSATAYAATIASVQSAVRSNGEELTRLGVAYQDQNGAVLGSNEILQNAAVVLATYKEGWDRTQAAKAIGMGSEKEIQAALSITAEKIQISKDRLVAYGLVIGEDTQQAVSRYQEAMRAFERESDLTSQGFKRAIADNIMPVLTDLAEFFRDGFPTAVMAFRYSMATITSLFYGLKTMVYIVTEPIVGLLDALGSGLVALISAAAKALSGDFAGAKATLVDSWSQAQIRLAAIGSNIVDQARHDSAAMALAWGADSLGASAIANARDQAGKAWKPKLDDAAGKDAELASMVALNKAEIEHIAILQKQATQTDQLTHSEELLEKLKTMSIAKYSAAALAERASYEAHLQEGIAIEKLNELRKKEEKATQAATDAHWKYLESIKQGLDKAQAEVKTIEEQTARIGLSKEAIAALDAAKLDLMATELERQAIRAYDKNLDDAEYAALMKTAAAYRDLGKAKVVNAQTETAMSDFLRVWNSIDRTAHDTFVNIFQGGQDAFTKLRDTLKATLLDLLYQMTLRKWIFNIVASVTGSSAASAAQQSVFGGNGMVGDITAGRSVYDIASGGMAGVGSTISSMGNLVGSASIASYGAGMGLTTAAASEAAAAYTAAAAEIATSNAALAATYTEVASSLSAGAATTAGASSALAAIPVWGWVALALSTQLGGPKIDKVGDGLSGTLSASGSSIQKRTDYTEDHHGLFGIGAFTTHNSAYSAADSGTTNYIDASVMAFTAATKGYASSIGLSVSAVENFTKQIDLSLTGLTAAQQQEEIDKAIASFVDDMVTSAYGGALAGVAKSGETSGATLQRLAIDFAIVNSNMQQLGGTMLPVGIEGAKAAAGLVDAFGGLDKMQSAISVYYNNFSSDAERSANATANLGAAFAKLGVSVPANEAQLNSLVGSIDVTTTAGQSLYASIINLAPAFHQATQAAQAAANNMLAAISNWGTSGDVRQAQAQILQRNLANSGLSLSMDQIMGATQETALAYYNSLDSNSREAQALLKYQQDIFNFVGGKKGAGQSGLVPYSPEWYAQGYGGGSTGSSGGGYSGGSNSGVGSVVSINNAADSIAQAMQAGANGIWDEVKRIRGLMDASGGAQGLADLQAQYAMTTASARAGSSDAAKALPGIVQALLPLLDATARTRTDMQWQRGQIAASLADTGSILSAQYGLSIPHFAVGTNYVPRDMLAMIHEGESITPKAYNPAAGGVDASSDLLAELQKVTQRLDSHQRALEKLVSSNDQMAFIALKDDTIGPAPARAAA